LRRAVSVTDTPSLIRPSRLRAAAYPNIVHGSRYASGDGASVAAPTYFGVKSDRGKIEFRWSGTQNESTSDPSAAR